MTHLLFLISITCNNIYFRKICKFFITSLLNKAMVEKEEVHGIEGKILLNFVKYKLSLQFLVR